MTYETFLASVGPNSAPPAGLAPELEALWHVKAGDWDRAHEIAQDIPTTMGSRVHGLLHAIEGDFANSAYWYRRAAKAPVDRAGIDGEWQEIVRELL